MVRREGGGGLTLDRYSLFLETNELAQCKYHKKYYADICHLYIMQDGEDGVKGGARGEGYALLLIRRAALETWCISISCSTSGNGLGAIHKVRTQNVTYFYPPPPRTQ